MGRLLCAELKEKYGVELPTAPSGFDFVGTLPSPDEYRVAFVGTRTPSEAAQGWVERLMDRCLEEAKASSQSLHVLSGLAEGVDQIAHRTALERGIRTTAILGTPLNRSGHPALCQRIVNHKGCVLTRHREGKSGYKALDFIERNEYIVALSHKVIAIDFQVRSGTSHTIAYALLWGRPLHVPLFSEGSQQLYRAVQASEAYFDPSQAGRHLRKAQDLLIEGSCGSLVHFETQL